MKKLFLVKLVAPTLMLLSSFSTWATPILQYNPTGAQNSGTSLAPAMVAPGLTATNLSQVGFESFWNNTSVWPVGRISSSSTIDLGQYLTFTIGSDASLGIDLDSLTYDKFSYLGSGPTSASIRSSVDAYATDIDAVTVNPTGFESLAFDLNALPTLTDPVTFRLYFYGAPVDSEDWADLVSTARSGNGLVLDGVTVPEPTSIALLGLGLVGLGLSRRRKTA